MEILKEKKPLGEVDSYISGLFDNKCHNTARSTSPNETPGFPWSL